MGWVLACSGPSPFLHCLGQGRPTGPALYLLKVWAKPEDPRAGVTAHLLGRAPEPWHGTAEKGDRHLGPGQMLCSPARDDEGVPVTRWAWHRHGGPGPCPPTLAASPHPTPSVSALECLPAKCLLPRGQRPAHRMVPHSPVPDTPDPQTHLWHRAGRRTPGPPWQTHAAPAAGGRWRAGRVEGSKAQEL